MILDIEYKDKLFSIFSYKDETKQKMRMGNLYSTESEAEMLERILKLVRTLKEEGEGAKLSPRLRNHSKLV